MKLEMVVVDSEIPPCVKRTAFRIAIPAAILAMLLAGGGALAYAGVPVAWTLGQPLKAADLNGNFTYLQNEINQLQQQSAPPGVVAAFAGPVVPSGWLLCDGAAVSRTTYASLFSAIGTVHGSGDGASTFNLPDYRGRFLRGVDHGSGRDPDATSRSAVASGGNVGDAVGSGQSWATGLPASGFGTTSNGAHAHNLVGAVYVGSGATRGTFAGGTPYALNASVTDSQGDHVHTVTGGDRETRPVNAYVEYIVKY